jgi:flagellar basal body-associated protein FliL
MGPSIGGPGPVAPWAAQPGPAAGAAAKPRGRRGLLITSIVLAVVLLLCGGGGLAAFLVLRDVDTAEGAPEPAVAVDRFMQAVYGDRNAALAATTVCPAARDADALERRVEEVDEYAKNYPSPKFRWETPKVDEQTPERAVVSVDLTVTTADDRQAEQELRFTVVQDSGWWVCDIG